MGWAAERWEKTRQRWAKKGRGEGIKLRASGGVQGFREPTSVMRRVASPASPTKSHIRSRIAWQLLKLTRKCTATSAEHENVRYVPRPPQPATWPEVLFQAGFGRSRRPLTTTNMEGRTDNRKPIAVLFVDRSLPAADPPYSSPARADVIRICRLACWREGCRQQEDESARQQAWSPRGRGGGGAQREASGTENARPVRLQPMRASLGSLRPKCVLHGSVSASFQRPQAPGQGTYKYIYFVG